MSCNYLLIDFTHVPGGWRVGEMALWQTLQQRWEDVAWELGSPVPAGPLPRPHKGVVDLLSHVFEGWV